MNEASNAAGSSVVAGEVGQVRAAGRGNGSRSGRGHEGDVPEPMPEAEKWRLPTKIVRQGGQLLHAQCWAWGQDIRHADGNLLLRYGFERRRPPAAVSGCSQYTFEQDGLLIRLWGFGVYAGAAEGMYLNRYEFIPRKAVLTDAWVPGRLGHGPRLYDRSLMLQFLDWVRLYEVWVRDVMGRSYRDAVLLRFGGQVASSLDLAEEWLRFKEALNRDPGDAPEGTGYETEPVKQVSLSGASNTPDVEQRMEDR